VPTGPYTTPGTLLLTPAAEYDLAVANQIGNSEELLDYVRDVSLRDDEILRELRAETADLPGGMTMQVMAEEGQLLALLVKLTGARTVVEVGTYTGYSALCMARALPADGRLVTCDITDKWPQIGAEFWKRAGVADRIDLRVGPALETLGALAEEWGTGSVDLAFVDADKANYAAYYEATLALLRPGGLIVVDNTLFFGRVIDPAAQDPDTVAIRALNAALRDDDRVEMSLLPMADGITLVRKRTADDA
jgi:O-methyltransferase